ncbi:predicted protein [Arabidopsis lyrata subsp. lyrata]|uniref:Predicted protein n=1 Tax=Arabidopsis lyrata subsp. lyrata TaxID=81972 RepID=D7ML14_ARALL|nr:predicted protein [Arabidopsis lyrata subsp. lyrata]
MKQREMRRISENWVGETERNRELAKQRGNREELAKQRETVKDSGRRVRDSGGGDEIPAEATRSLVEDERRREFWVRRRRLGTSDDLVNINNGKHEVYVHYI